MKAVLLVSFGLALSSCVMAPPELPRQELPRQELARPDIQPKQSALTPGMVKKHIEIKKTTQTEIIEIFGPPDMVTKSGSGEMWGYDKVSREVAEAAVGARVGARTGATSSLGAGGLGLAGAGAGGIIGGVLGGLAGGYGQSVGQSSQQTSDQSRRTESTTTVFLLVYFDEKGVVNDYRLSATKF